MAVKVSFVIPCSYRFNLLKETLASIAAQDFAHDDIEIIVIAQGDQKNLATMQYPDSDKSKPALSVILVDAEGTISRSRNIGAAKAQGDYLAFIDADVALSKNWLTEMLVTLNAGPHILAAAVQRCDSDAPTTERVRTALVRIAKDTNVGSTTGQNLLVRREDFDQIGGFPEHLHTCEDVYFTQALSLLGTLRLSSEADFKHLGEDMTFTQLFKKEIWRGSSNLAALEGRKIPLREYPSYIIPFFQLFLACVLVFGLITFNFTIVITALIVSLFFPLIYSYRVVTRSDTKVSMPDTLRFYYVYFFARAIGVAKGIGAMITSVFSGKKVKPY